LTLPGGTAGTVARYIAPAAFLLAVTAVVLIVRSTLRSNDKPASTTTGVAHVATTKGTPATRPRLVPAPRRYYVIQGGDTFDAIAARFSTTVDVLLRLNPGAQPTTLTPGEQIRIK
jgi:LysM repeat protein